MQSHDDDDDDSNNSKPSPPMRRRRIGQIVVAVLFFAFALTCLTKALQIVLTLNHNDTVDIYTLLRSWGLPASTAYRTSYPTAFTRDIQPRPIHSHNDYWRQVPFYSALAVGAVSVEADVWEYDGELYVGHETESLTRNRTFQSLYVHPILSVLSSMNSGGEIGIERDPEPLRGVFDVDPRQTLHLYIDLKTLGESTLPVVIRQLEPLRSPRNFLTRWNGTHLIHGCVTVHLTGETPFELMLREPRRDYFFDAPLGQLAGGKYNTSNSLMGTAAFGREIGKVLWGSGGMSERMKDKVRAQVKEAHERGIGVRYWDTPGWPISVRNAVWSDLVGLGVDLLNVDDLKAAAEMAW